MVVHRLQSILGLVSVALEEEQQTLLVEEFPIVLDLVLFDMFVELVEFLAFVVIVLNLAVVEEATAFLALFCLLLLLWVGSRALLGKKR